MTEREALAVLRGDDPVGAARAATALWQMWHQSGQPRLDALLLQGIEAMQRQQLEEADGLFTRLIETAPQFAEGWNKRATVRYLAKNYVASIADRGQGRPHGVDLEVPEKRPDEHRAEHTADGSSHGAARNVGGGHEEPGQGHIRRTSAAAGVRPVDQPRPLRRQDDVQRVKVQVDHEIGRAHV